MKGKIDICSRISLDKIFEDEMAGKGVLDLIIYSKSSSGCRANTSKQVVYDYTSKWNNVAIICD